MKQDWKKYYRELSREHREQIHRFCGGTKSDFDNDADLARRHYMAYMKWRLLTEIIPANVIAKRIGHKRCGKKKGE